MRDNAFCQLHSCKNFDSEISASPPMQADCGMLLKTYPRIGIKRSVQLHEA
jgi:hypothetical protein